MYKTTELDLDATVKALLDSQLGILLLQSDNTDIDMYGILSNKCTYEDRQGMYGYNTHVTYHLYNISYHKTHIDKTGFDECMYVHARADAIHNIFIRWTDKGYNKRHAKDPYGCKAFLKYLDEIEWKNADYMLLMVD